MLVSPVTPAPLRNFAGNSFTGLAPALYARHRFLLLSHILTAMIACITGLFQFAGRLRDHWPQVHRTLGLIYVAAVVGSSIAAFPLALAWDALPPEQRTLFYPMSFSFALLALVWPCATLTAFRHARNRIFGRHREWMLRSYSLTFAFVTVRLFSFVLLFITQNPLIALDAAVVSWPLNLLAAQWIIVATKPRAQVVAA